MNPNSVNSYGRLRWLISLLFLSFLGINANAQEDIELLKRYDNRFAELNSLIFNPIQVYNSYSENTEKSFSMPTVVIDSIYYEIPDSLINRKVEEQIRAFKGKTGLQISGQTYYRPEGELGIDDEDYAVSSYRAKIQAELRWYFFQSSLFQRKGQINEFRLKGEMERIAQEKENIGILYTRQIEAFQARYDSLLFCVLTQRIKNLDLLSETHFYLLENENISTDELLDVLNEKAEAERQLTSIPSEYGECNKLPSIAGILIKIDVAAYMNEVHRQYADLSLLEIEAALIEQQKKNMTFLSEVRVAPFIRYSHYARTALPNSQNVDVGLSFIIPLSPETGRKRKVLEAESRMIEAKREETVSKVEEQVLLVLKDVERYNRLIQGELAREDELKGYLRIRNKAYENAMGEYSRQERIKEYNSYLRCLEKLLYYQFLRDSSLADLQRFLGNTPIQNFCSLSFIEY